MKIKNKAYAIIAILFWIAVWHISATLVGKTILLPTPLETVRVFLALSSDLAFWEICFLSVKSIFAGLLGGILVGTVIAGLSYISPLLKELFSPLLSLVKATPIASVIILFLVWIGKDKIPVFVSLMMVTPIVASNTLEGLYNIDKSLWEVTKLYKFGFFKSWKFLYRHSLLPYVSSALKSGISLAWKAGIAAEVLCTPMGTIGERLYESKLYMEMPELFAWTLAVVLISLFLELVVVKLTERLLGGVRNER